MGFSCDCDDTYVSFSRVSFPKARKAAVCCECGHAITPGETYEFFICKQDGELFQSKTCERCSDLAQSFVDLGYCRSYGGGLWEDYADWLTEQPAKLDENGDPIPVHVIVWALRKKHKGTV